MMQTNKEDPAKIISPHYVITKGAMMRCCCNCSLNLSGKLSVCFHLYVNCKLEQLYFSLTYLCSFPHKISEQNLFRKKNIQSNKHLIFFPWSLYSSYLVANFIQNEIRNTYWKIKLGTFHNCKKLLIFRPLCYRFKAKKVSARLTIGPMSILRQRQYYHV